MVFFVLDPVGVEDVQHARVDTLQVFSLCHVLQTWQGSLFQKLHDVKERLEFIFSSYFFELIKSVGAKYKISL